MELKHLLPSLLFTTSLFHLIQNPGVYCQSPTSNDGTDFIKKSCQSTLYPDFCFKALSRYASKVGNDRVKLAIESLSYTLPKAQAVKDYTIKLNHTKLDPNLRVFVSQCVELLDDAVYNIQLTLDEMKKEKYNFQDIILWLSEALTCEEDCIEGFDDDSVISDVKSDVISRNWEITMLTSISLCFVDYRSGPE